MVYVLLIMLILLNAFWLVLVVFGLPGNWLIVVSTCLFAWWRWGDRVFSIYTLIAIVILAVLGELFEFLGGMHGAKSGGELARFNRCPRRCHYRRHTRDFSDSNPVSRDFARRLHRHGLGAWAMEFSRGKKMKESVRYAVGAGLGEFLGITSKFALGIIIWFTVAVAAFWP